jgi:hypothetical protein
MISMLAAFRVGALGNHCGRPQNGTASTGKLNHSNVREGKASNSRLCQRESQVFHHPGVVNHARMWETVHMGNKNAPKREKRKPPKNK